MKDNVTRKIAPLVYEWIRDIKVPPVEWLIYGVLLLKGNVRVSNRAGAVTLNRPGWGTDIPLRRQARR